MPINIVAAMTENGVIGKNDKLPWRRLQDDMDHFSNLTKGSVVVMGSTTFHGLPKKYKPLPDRENIVLSRSADDWVNEGDITVLSTFSQVLERAEKETVWVIGGSEIFALALPHTSEMLLTRVQATLPGDSFFPIINWEEWEKGSTVASFLPGERNEYGFTIEYYKRCRNEFIEMTNCRTDEQRAEMQLILHRNHCPFCPENLKKYHDNPILWSGIHWVVSHNDYPYPNSGKHFIFILKTHVSSISDLPTGAMEDLRDAIRWTKTAFGLNGAAFFMRSGDPLETGATIRHLHGHLATRKEKGKPVTFHLG